MINACKEQNETRIRILYFINNIHLPQQRNDCKIVGIKIPARHLISQTTKTWMRMKLCARLRSTIDFFIHCIEADRDIAIPPRDIESPIQCNVQWFWQSHQFHHDEWRVRKVIDVIVNLSYRAHCGLARRHPYWCGRERELIDSSEVRSLSSWNWDESDSHSDLSKLSCIFEISTVHLRTVTLYFVFNFDQLFFN